MILGEDGDKMSKSKGNVVNPLEIIEEFGADTLRLYILFIGDYEQSTPWNPNGVKGSRRFLDKLARIEDKVSEEPNDNYQVELHKTIKAVSEDIENVKFNTAIAKLMSFVNILTKEEHVNKKDYEMFLSIVYPFAPHLCEELWSKLGHTDDMVYAPWPKYDESKLLASTIQIVVSINGKVKDKLNISVDMAKEEVLALAKKAEKIVALLEGKTIRKEIYVPNKLVNIVAN